MKIAFITTNLRGGGAEKAVINLAANLSGRNHEVHIILFEQIIEHALPSGLALYSLGRENRKISKGMLGKYFCAFRLNRLMRKLSATAPFELIVSTLPFADEVVKLAGIKPVWHRIANTLSAEISLLEKSSPGKAARRYARYRKLYHGANIIAVSEGVGRDLREYFRLERTQIEQIHNPFDMAAIRKMADKPDPDLPNVPYVIHVGRFAPQKRHDLLLESWKKLGAKEHKLVLLTKPDESLSQLIRKNGLESQVIVAGFHKNPYPWIKNASLLVLCSDHEGMPNVLVEALACGTPIVSTDCPSGPRELMTGTLRDFLVPTGDAGALSSAIFKALRYPPDLLNIALDTFDAEQVVQHYERLPSLWRDMKRA